MSKYLAIFITSWQNEFIYRLNFVLWRLRNILRLLMTYFLWSGIFLTHQQVFGYSQPEILTYIFMVLVVQTVVLSAPSSDNIGGEISNGDLSNYLLKPINYLTYWFTRDLSSKLLNISFATFEIVVLWIILRPNLTLPDQPIIIFSFILALSLAALLYYFLNVSTRFVAFWTPENVWGLSFVSIVLIEILAGGIFPLDILPNWLTILLQFTPFPYLVYYPIAIFLGKFSAIEIVRIIIQTGIWVLVMYYLTKFIWKKGLIIYSSEGR